MSYRISSCIMRAILIKFFMVKREGVGRVIHAYMISEMYFVHRKINYIITYFPQVYINGDKILNNQIVMTYAVIQYMYMRKDTGNVMNNLQFFCDVIGIYHRAI